MATERIADSCVGGGNGGHVHGAALVSSGLALARRASRTPSFCSATDLETAIAREQHGGPFIFADTVPQGLRQRVRDLYETVDTQLDRIPVSEPGIVFVIWRPDSPRSDFRLVRSLNRTRLLVFNGPSWEQGFTTQQHTALSKDLAQEQIAAALDAPAVE